jgi:hypothetical protein
MTLRARSSAGKSSDPRRAAVMHADGASGAVARRDAPAPRGGGHSRAAPHPALLGPAWDRAACI